MKRTRAEEGRRPNRSDPSIFLRNLCLSSDERSWRNPSERDRNADIRIREGQTRGVTGGEPPPDLGRNEAARSKLGKKHAALNLQQSIGLMLILIVNMLSYGFWVF